MKKRWQSTGCLCATWWHRSGGGQHQKQYKWWHQQWLSLVDDSNGFS